MLDLSLNELRNLVRNQLTEIHISVRENYIRQKNHLRMVELFDNSINEMDVETISDVDKKRDILEKIKTNSYERQNPQSFYNALSKSKRKEMLTDYSPSELSKMKLFKLTDYDIGFALKKRDSEHSEIVAVFNNEDGVTKIGKELIASAVRNGGKYLDHFDGFLSDLYSSAGFVEYKREKFNPDYDEDESFRKKYGESDIIYRVHKDSI